MIKTGYAQRQKTELRLPPVAGYQKKLVVDKIKIDLEAAFFKRNATGSQPTR